MPALGGHMSEEHKRKIGLAHLGKKESAKTIKKNRLAHLGIKHTEEAKRKIKLNHARPMLGKHHSEEAKQKNRLAHLGKKASKETRHKMSESRRGEKNPFYGKGDCFAGDKSSNWKGDDVGYGALHTWIRKQKPGQTHCQRCGKVKPLHLANIQNHKYTRNPDDYEYMCVKCHADYDLKMRNLVEMTNNIRRYLDTGELPGGIE